MAKVALCALGVGVWAVLMDMPSVIFPTIMVSVMPPIEAPTALLSEHPDTGVFRDEYGWYGMIYQGKDRIHCSPALVCCRCPGGVITEDELQDMQKEVKAMSAAGSVAIVLPSLMKHLELCNEGL